MRVLACTLLLVSPLVLPAQQPDASSRTDAPATVTMHIFTKTDASGFVDEMSKERQKATTELTKRLRKEKGVKIVDGPEQAHVVVEITQASIVRAGERKTVTGMLFGAPPGSGNPNAKVPEIRAILRAGDYSVEMVGGSDLRWKQCWNELAAQLKIWLKDNRTRLAAKR